MIPNITRGGRAYGVIRYLVSESSRNAHTEPRLVAGSVEVLGVARGRVLERGDVGELAAILDEPREAAGKRVTIPVRDGDGQIVARRDAHVWHCSLSLHPEEPALSGERWRVIASEFVAKMGFAGEGAAYDCPWLAIRHGVSGGGNDHVHLVVGLVDEQGRVASTHYDRPRSQKAARELEVAHGLRGLVSAGLNVNGRGLQHGEIECDQRRGRPDARASGHGAELSGRQTLERIVRACAAAAGDESEFLALVRERHVSVRARYGEGGRERVVGYSVALGDSARFGGGRLAKDLTLPALRRGWAQSPEAERAALEQWRRDPSTDPDERVAERLAGARGISSAKAAAAIDALRVALAAASGDAARTAEIAGQGAAVLSAWSLAAEGSRGRVLARAARQLARTAERPTETNDSTPTRPPAAKVDIGALCLLILAGRGDPTAEWALVAIALTRLCGDIARVHAARGELARAREMEQRLRNELAEIRASSSLSTAKSTSLGGLTPPRAPRAGEHQGPDHTPRR